MRLINEFIERALNNSGSFTINISNNEENDVYNYHFLQSNVGKARYIYGMKSYNDEKFYSDVDLKPKLIAIVSEGIVYIVDEIFLDGYRWLDQEDTLLPNSAKRFDELVKETNEYISNIIFAHFYKSLEVQDVTEENAINKCRKHARSYLFSKEPMALFDDEKLNEIFNVRDVANILCGFGDVETEARKRLETRRVEWTYKKSMNEKIKSLMKDPETAYDWEIAIAEGIRSVDAKTVTVEFELNGKRASGKISPYTVIRVLDTNDNFSGYNFEVMKHGDKLLKDLGAGDYQSENALRCNHIVKITYGKKELYVRK